jgi:co-chaperonin GroES (HSP10)
MPEYDGYQVTDARPDRTIVKDYEPFKPLLDRILVKRIDEIVGDDGFIVPEKYRQHSNWGEVIAVGDTVVLGGERIPLTDFVNIGDICRYGEYCAEAYSVDDPSLFIVRLQDCRGVRRLVKANS